MSAAERCHWHASTCWCQPRPPLWLRLVSFVAGYVVGLLVVGGRR